MKYYRSFGLVYLFMVCFFCCKNDVKSEHDSHSNEITTYEQFFSEMQQRGYNTGNVLVYEKGEVVHQSSNGLRSISPMDSLDLNSQFRLASVSKQFTAMAIMKLKEAGQIDYDQSVKSILPDFPYETITVRHLLHHTSGLTDYVRLVEENLPEEFERETQMIGNDEAMEFFYRLNPELDFQPGEKWEYSNTGYMFLASIVEKISGMHLKDFLKLNVFDPIGMSDTMLFSYQKEADPQMPNRVFGYRKALNQKDLLLNDYHFMNGVRGDGGIYSTLNDLLKWNLALANYTIIPKSYLEEAWSSGQTSDGENTGYGFGYELDYNPGEPIVVLHSGGWVGFGTFLFNAVDDKSGFIVLTNDSGEHYGPLISGLFDLKDGKSVAIPKPAIWSIMAEKIYEDGIDSAVSFYNSSKADNADGYNFDEAQLNGLGYRLMNEDMNAEALKVFQLNIDAFPDSANVYDSYADALIVKGDSLGALENYKRCFKMDSTLTYAKDKALALAERLKIEIQLDE